MNGDGAGLDADAGAFARLGASLAGLGWSLGDGGAAGGFLPAGPLEPVEALPAPKELADLLGGLIAP